MQRRIYVVLGGDQLISGWCPCIRWANECWFVTRILSAALLIKPNRMALYHNRSKQCPLAWCKGIFVNHWSIIGAWKQLTVELKSKHNNTITENVFEHVVFEMAAIFHVYIYIHILRDDCILYWNSKNSEIYELLKVLKRPLDFKAGSWNDMVLNKGNVRFQSSSVRTYAKSGLLFLKMLAFMDFIKTNFYEMSSLSTFIWYSPVSTDACVPIFASLNPMNPAFMILQIQVWSWKMLH